MTSPLLLVTTAHPTLLTHTCPITGEVHPNLGRLLQPRHTSSVEATAASGIPWAADNDCFNGLDDDKYLAMLDRFARLHELGDCKFVTVPDVVRCVYCDRTADTYGGDACLCEFSREKIKIVYGDAELTLRRFEEWQPLLADLGLPIGYVLQDGSETVGVPWEAIDALFIGGSTDFKLGPAAAEYARQAAMLGKWVHWGRVNSEKRIRHCIGTGACGSFDGSKWARWRKTWLDGGLALCRDIANQATLFDVVSGDRACPTLEAA